MSLLQHCNYDIIVQVYLHAVLFGKYDPLGARMLAFSVIIILISAVLSKRRDKMDRAEIATYIVLIAGDRSCGACFLQNTLDSACIRRRRNRKLPPVSDIQQTFQR